MKRLSMRGPRFTLSSSRRMARPVLMDEATCGHSDEHASASRILSGMIPGWSKYEDRISLPSEFSSVMKEDLEGLILRLAHGPVVRTTAMLPNSWQPLPFDDLQEALSPPTPSTNNGKHPTRGSPSLPRERLNSVRQKRDSLDDLGKILRSSYATKSTGAKQQVLRSFPPNLPARVQDEISRERASQLLKKTRSLKPQSTFQPQNRGVRLKEALKIIEDVLPDTSDVMSKNHQKSLRSANRLIVKHVSSPTTPWHELCMLLEPESPFVRHLDTITIGCILLELARKGPSPMGMSSIKHKRRPSDVTTSPAPQEMTRKALCRLLWLCESKIDDFSLESMATTLLGLSILHSQSQKRGPWKMALGRVAESLLQRLPDAAKESLLKSKPHIDPIAPRSLIVALLSMARLGYRPASLPKNFFLSLKSIISLFLPHFTPEELATLPLSLAQLGLYNSSRWLDSYFADYVSKNLGQMKPTALISLVCFIGTRSKLSDAYRPTSKQIEAIISAACYRLPSFKGREIWVFLLGLAKMGHTPNQLWLRALEAHLTPRLLLPMDSSPIYSAIDISIILGALASFTSYYGHQPALESPTRANFDLFSNLLPASVDSFSALFNEEVGGKSTSRFLGALSTLIARNPDPLWRESIKRKLTPALTNLADKISAKRVDDELDEYLTIQSITGLLEILGNATPRNCLQSLEATLLNLKSSDRIVKSRKKSYASESCWRRLMAAYTGAGLSPTSSQLARILIIMGS